MLLLQIFIWIDFYGDFLYWSLPQMSHISLEYNHIKSCFILRGYYFYEKYYKHALFLEPFFHIYYSILKPFKISGRIRKLNMPQSDTTENLKYALFATCTPARTSLSVLEIRMKSTLFCTKNRIDLSFLDLDARYFVDFLMT